MLYLDFRMGGGKLLREAHSFYIEFDDLLVEEKSQNERGEENVNKKKKNGYGMFISRVGTYPFLLVIYLLINISVGFQDEKNKQKPKIIVKEEQKIRRNH